MRPGYNKTAGRSARIGRPFSAHSYELAWGVESRLEGEISRMALELARARKGEAGRTSLLPGFNLAELW